MHLMMHHSEGSALNARVRAESTSRSTVGMGDKGLKRGGECGAINTMLKLSDQDSDSIKLILIATNDIYDKLLSPI